MKNPLEGLFGRKKEEAVRPPNANDILLMEREAIEEKIREVAPEMAENGRLTWDSDKVVWNICVRLEDQLHRTGRKSVTPEDIHYVTLQEIEERRQRA